VTEFDPPEVDGERRLSGRAADTANATVCFRAAGQPSASAYGVARGFKPGWTLAISA
jgi:hypothetical protein